MYNYFCFLPVMSSLYCFSDWMRQFWSRQSKKKKKAVAFSTEARAIKTNPTGRTSSYKPATTYKCSFSGLLYLIDLLVDIAYSCSGSVSLSVLWYPAQLTPPGCLFACWQVVIRLVGNALTLMYCCGVCLVWSLIFEVRCGRSNQSWAVRRCREAAGSGGRWLSWPANTKTASTPSREVSTIWTQLQTVRDFLDHEFCHQLIG